MELRLVLPVLLLAVAASLTGAVDSALAPASGFSLQPDDGSFALLRMSGPDGRSPALSWGEPPPATRAFAIVAEDLDAPDGQRVFWAVWNLSPHVRHLEEGMAAGPRTASGARQAHVPGRGHGYRAPSFLAAARHRLRFTVYALARPLDLPDDAPASLVRDAAWDVARTESDWNAGGGWLAKRSTEARR